MMNLKDALANLDEETTLRLVKERFATGDEPPNILEDLRYGMEVLGQRFADCEYSLAELLMGAEIFKECMEIIRPGLEKDPASALGKVVIGTVKGDIHDLGKNIVVAMLRGSGFDVYDLGVNAPPDRFIEKITEVEADVVGLSCLLSTTLDSMRKTVTTIKESGLRTKILVGGGVFAGRYEGTAINIEGADGFGKDAIEAVRMAKKLVKSRKRADAMVRKGI